ncbi:MAG: hypothetical protein Q9161_009583 [Pseudevernia consocians]
MAYFNRNHRSYTLPENSPSLSIDIHRASEAHPSISYTAPYLRPPSGQLNALGLKTRIDYGNKLRKIRDISPRTMTFINWWKDRCHALLQASPFARKNLTQEVEILDNEMQSRYDKIHGNDGLCTALMELFNAMAELRLRVEYGDYLAHTCSALKAENMSDMIWKVKRLDWQEVGRQVKKEETTRAEEERRRLPLSSTPYLDDIAKAAARLGHDFRLVRYQILAYAERNDFCHSGVKSMIDYGEFQELAERIVEDKRALEIIYRGRPHEQIQMRGVIKIVEKEWFETVFVDERKGRVVRFIPSDRAVEKMRKMESAALARS